MRTLRMAILPVVLLALVAGVAPAQEKKGDAADKAYAEMKEMLGMVPSFMKAFPREAVPAAWEEMKALEMNPNTALSGKSKELIGLAVAAQIPCDYCVYFHMESARAKGATEKEIQEAIAMAAITRHWSTVLNGALIDEKEFRKETDKMIEHSSRMSKGDKSSEDKKMSSR